jgi:copper chaperone
MTSLSIPDMSCGHCVKKVEEALKGVSGVTDVRVSLDDKSAEVEGDFQRDAAVQAVEGAGYTVA